MAEDDEIYDYYDEEEKQIVDENDDYDSILHLSREPSIRTQDNPYVILTSADVFERLTNLINDTAELTATSFDDALVLMHQFRWNKDLFSTKYFQDPDRVLAQCGIAKKSKGMDIEIHKENEETCPICFYSENQEKMLSPPCGHLTCDDCWRDYIADKVRERISGPFMRCPHAGCTQYLPHSFICNILKHEEALYKMYITSLCKMYIEENKSFKWCPRPDCEYSVEYPNLVAVEVKCKCGQVFCFKCVQESHRPCSCGMVVEWKSKNSKESESTNWILKYTKLCPKCRKPIEKNQGCNHMTCRPPGCGYEFCWICLADWKNHNSSSNKCNLWDQREAMKKKTEIDKDKSDLEKYVFYFERFSNYEKAQKHAVESLGKVDQRARDLHDKRNLEFRQVTFLQTSLDELIRCRRVLKWTYCYAFYLPKNHSLLFEQHQLDLEMTSDKLQEHIENFERNFQDILEPLKYDLKQILEMRQAIVDTQIVTSGFCDKMLQAFEENDWGVKMQVVF
eukprot:TRINITY_DN8034_c0_g1_i2.p1 TRINITY_DN8034_c0_g1~~TRINITY_DN8034_c0_g1_i2.p1  ORF type:complete len:508 (-),score=83.35 TRINITY_DN8034_c0_g1_i2:310-1833(-)